MGLPNVIINITTGNLGGVAAGDDGVCGIIGFCGTAPAGHAMGAAKLYKSLKGAETAGITKAWSDNDTQGGIAVDVDIYAYLQSIFSDYSQFTIVMTTDAGNPMLLGKKMVEQVAGSELTVIFLVNQIPMHMQDGIPSVAAQGIFAEIENFGITHDWSVDNVVVVDATSVDAANSLWYDLRDFFAVAGDGSSVYVSLQAAADSDAGIRSLLSDRAVVDGLMLASQGSVRMIGVSHKPSYSLAADNMIDAYIAPLDNIAEQLTVEMKPFVWVLGGIGWKGVASVLTNQRLGTQKRVCVTLIERETPASINVGLVLGKLASVPVQRNIGRVKDGGLPFAYSAIVYGTSGTSILKTDEIDAATLHDKGYIVTRRFVNRNDMFVNDDPNANLLSDDFNSVSRVRTIDKAMLITYNTYVNEINDEVLITNGKLDPGIAKALQAKIENQIGLLMQAEGEISSVRCVIDTNQDVLATGKIVVKIYVVPVGQLKEIEVDLGFSKE